MDKLLDKLPKNQIKKLYRFDPKSAVDSLKRPGVSHVGTTQPLPKGDPVKKPFIVVFRHGISEDNTAKLFSGWRDNTKLTKEGEEQAKILYEPLKNIDFDYYFQSDQVRSQHTLELAMGGRKYEPIIDWRIKERNYGDLNGTSKSELMEKDLLRAVLYRRSWDYPPPRGESMEMVFSRVGAFIKELEYVLKKEQASAVISCSNNSMRPIRAHFEKLTIEQAMGLENPTGKDYCLYNL